MDPDSELSKQAPKNFFDLILNTEGRVICSSYPLTYPMTEPGRNKGNPIGLVTLFQSGTLTVKANGLPVMKLDGGERSVDLEIQGIKECGIKLSKFMKLESGGKGLRGALSASEATAKSLSEDGWALALYDRGNRILKMGRGVSRLTGHIEVNLLKFRSILENL